MDIVSDPQQGHDPDIASVPSVDAGAVPQMDMERVLPRQQSTGMSRGINQLGSPNVFVDSGNNQIIVSKTDNQVTTNQVLMGDQANFGEGFYVTKPGIPVDTAKNTSDFIFNSNQNIFKIVKTDAFRVALTADLSQYVSIPHDLDFAPIPMAYLISVTDGAINGNFPFPVSAGINVDIVNHVINTTVLLRTSADEQYAYFECLNSTGSALGTFSIRYYLLQETSGNN